MKTKYRAICCTDIAYNGCSHFIHKYVETSWSHVQICMCAKSKVLCIFFCFTTLTTFSSVLCLRMCAVVFTASFFVQVTITPSPAVPLSSHLPWCWALWDINKEIHPKKVHAVHEICSIQPVKGITFHYEWHVYHWEYTNPDEVASTNRG